MFTPSTKVVPLRPQKVRVTSNYHKIFNNGY